MDQNVTFRLAHPGDAVEISRMLKALADHLGVGDVFVTGPDLVQRHGFGDNALFQSMIAEQGAQAVGLALFFPHFSTYRGQPGAYVQDLWVDPRLRGQEVGAKLLARVARHAEAEWQAGYMALAVHIDNRDALRFYDRLGFQELTTDRPYVIDKEAFQQLRRLHHG